MGKNGNGNGNKSKNKKAEDHEEKGNKNKKAEDDEEKGEEKKEQEKKITEVILKVYMHCETCKNKVSKCLKASHGVEEVTADVGNQKVVIKGKDLNPKKILEEIRKKYSKNVELISPKELPDNPKQTKPDPKKEEIPIKTVELKMNMHCEGCAKHIKQTIGRMEGVLTVETDKESSKVTVKGAVDPPKLVESIKKKMGKNVEMVKKKEEKDNQTKASAEEKPGKNKDANNQENEKNVVFKYPPQYSLLHIYPDQTFSDDNVFSCSIM